jgi:hypothetical protein
VTGPAPPIPPITPGLMVRPKVPVWPSVIGIVAIVVGAIGLVQYGCFGLIGQVIGQIALETMRESGFDDAMTAAPMEAQRKYMVPSILSTLAHAGLAALLLAAGIGLTRRRRWSVRAVRLWSVLRIILAVPAVGLQWLLMREQFQAISTMTVSGQQPMPAMLMPLMQGIGYAVLPLGLLWASALPVFMLIWLSLGRARQEWTTWT